MCERDQGACIGGAISLSTNLSSYVDSLAVVTL